MSVTELPVKVCGIGLLCPAGIGLAGATGGRPGEVPGFRAQAYISDRKSLKLMSRSVKLGVSCIRIALSEAGELDDLHPGRRGIYVGASPQPGDPEDLRLALERSMGPDGFGVGRFATEGYPVIHPLWLVRGLSNNVLGIASANHDLQGTNSNYCDGPEGGWTALLEGAMAVAEGRADAVIAGGADSLIEAEPLLGGRRCGEAAAFIVLRPSDPGMPPMRFDRDALDAAEADLGYLGAATWPVAFARMLLRR
jgi:3-oxoacyl-(acyl-carrier-protein) synthase